MQNVDETIYACRSRQIGPIPGAALAAPTMMEDSASTSGCSCASSKITINLQSFDDVPSEADAHGTHVKANVL